MQPKRSSRNRRRLHNIDNAEAQSGSFQSFSMYLAFLERVGVVILSMGGERLDTCNPNSKLVLTILAGVATWEREVMKERQAEGIAKAQADGKYKGRATSIDAAEVMRLRETMGPAAHRQATRHRAIERVSDAGADRRGPNAGWRPMGMGQNLNGHIDVLSDRIAAMQTRSNGEG
jgi:hypothetical protein